MVLSELLASYDKLRKRRYSLSKRIISEGRGEFGFMPTNMPDREFAAQGAAIFAMAKLIGSSPAEKGSPETKQPYVHWISSRERIGWRDSRLKVKNETPKHAFDYIMSKQKELGGELPQPKTKETDFGDPGVFGELAPPVIFAPDSHAERSDKNFDKWGLDRTKENVTRTAPERSAEEDMKGLNDQLQNRGQGDVRDILDSIHDGIGEEGMWSDPEMLQNGTDELSLGFDALNKVMEENDISDDCLNLDKVSPKEKKALKQFRTRSSDRNASLWWDGDSIFARRAINDSPGNTDVQAYGIRLFGYNTAMYKMAKAVAGKPECGDDSGESVIQHGRNDPRSAASLGSVIVGDSNETLGKVAEVYEAMDSGEELSESDREKFDGALVSVLEKVIDGPTAQTIRYLDVEILKGRGDEILEDPYLSHLKDEVDALQERHPNLKLKNGNHILLAFIGEEILKRRASIQALGRDADWQKHSTGKGATGVQAALDENGDPLSSSTKADGSFAATDRVLKVVDDLVGEDEKHLTVGRQPNPPEREGRILVSQKTSKHLGFNDFGGFNLETLMNPEKMIGLARQRFATQRVQVEEARRLGLDQHDIPDEVMDEAEKFCIQEHADEIEELEAVKLGLENPREFDKALRRQGLQPAFDEGGEEIWKYREQLEEIKEKEKQLKEKPDSSARKKELHDAKIHFLKNWTNARRARRLQEDPENVEGFMALQTLNGGSSTHDELIEDNSGGQVTFMRESVVFDGFFNAIIGRTGNAGVVASFGRGSWSFKGYDRRMDEDRPVFKTYSRFSAPGGGRPGRMRTQTHANGPAMKKKGKNYDEIIASLGRANPPSNDVSDHVKFKYHMGEFLRLAEKVGAVDL